LFKAVARMNNKFSRKLEQMETALARFDALIRILDKQVKEGSASPTIIARLARLQQLRDDLDDLDAQIGL
jgi:hypothetical protein